MTWNERKCVFGYSFELYCYYLVGEKYVVIERVKVVITWIWNVRSRSRTVYLDNRDPTQLKLRIVCTSYLVRVNANVLNSWCTIFLMHNCSCNSTCGDFVCLFSRQVTSSRFSQNWSTVTARYKIVYYRMVEPTAYISLQQIMNSNFCTLPCG